MVYYIADTGSLEAVFNIIATRYSQSEEVPSYRDEKGFPDLISTLERVKEDNYYPDLYSKAAYLFINLNQGHFFSNGNKRLSIVALTFFLGLNLCVFKNENKEWYKEKLINLFPECSDIDFEDFSDFTSVDFCVYHLAIRTAASGKYNIDHQVLKDRVYKFFQEVIEAI